MRKTRMRGAWLVSPSGAPGVRRLHRTTGAASVRQRTKSACNSQCAIRRATHSLRRDRSERFRHCGSVMVQDCAGSSSNIAPICVPKLHSSITVLTSTWCKELHQSRWVEPMVDYMLSMVAVLSCETVPWRPMDEYPTAKPPRVLSATGHGHCGERNATQTFPGPRNPKPATRRVSGQGGGVEQEEHRVALRHRAARASAITTSTRRFC